jgi:ATP-dependent RNA helicase RhlE
MKESFQLMSFDNLGLAEPLLRALQSTGYEVATSIQDQAIPIALKGRDIMGCAQTGTGKTAAYALPILQRLCAENTTRKSREKGTAGSGRVIRSLILAPTRELVAQINASFNSYGRFSGLRCTAVFGGVSQMPQVRALRAGVDILVATPGRLLDLMQQGYIDLSKVSILTLDEADQMLDMGFLPALRRIVSAVPRRRQTMMFSATMPDEIRDLANQWLHAPEYVEVDRVATPAEQVSQSVYFIETAHKPQLLAHLLRHSATRRTLVFARTKHGADKIAKILVRSGIPALAIHGNKSQNARTRTLELFKSSDPPVLIATDIAARGLDVKDISHVINYELPEVPETYVHRIGRTGRAGTPGLAIAFCSREERCRLRDIERLTRQSIRVESDQPELDESPESSDSASRPRPAKSGAKSGEKSDFPTDRHRRRNAAHGNSGYGTSTATRRPTGSKRPAKRRRRAFSAR